MGERCPTCGQKLLPRAGEVLGLVAEVIGIEYGRQPFKVSAIADRLQTVPRKQVYNAIGYLRRRGKLTKLGYGEYRVVEARP